MPDDANDQQDAAPREPAREAGTPGAGTHRAAAEAAEEAFFTRDEAYAAAPAAGEEEELDPELLKLPRPRRRRHPLISLAVIGLSGYMLYALRADIAFYFQPSKPLDLGDAADAVQAGKLEENAFVTVRGAPDRKHALILESSFGGYESLYRLLQTSNRVFVRQHRKTRTVDREVEYVHTGRVVRFADVPHLQKLKAYFARTMTHAHDLSFAAVRDAKRGGGAGPVQLRSRTGATVSVHADTLVWINVEHPGEWVIQADRRTYPKEERARALLGDLGMPYATDDELSHVHHRFVVLTDEAGVAALRKRFADRALRVSVVPRQVGYTARWDRLEISGAGLRINAHDPLFPARYELEPASGDEPPKLKAVRDKTVTIPERAIRYLTVSTKLAVPDDALLIVTRDRPGDYWFYLLLYGVLGAFIVLNGYTLASRFIPRK